MAKPVKQQQKNVKKVDSKGGKKKKDKKVSFAEAQQVYLKLKQEKDEERQREREERQKRNEAIQEQNKSRKKMNQALKKKNKKGQPNLNAQVEVLLERIQKRVGKDGK